MTRAQRNGLIAGILTIVAVTAGVIVWHNASDVPQAVIVPPHTVLIQPYWGDYHPEVLESCSAWHPFVDCELRLQNHDEALATFTAIGDTTGSRIPIDEDIAYGTPLEVTWESVPGVGLYNTWCEVGWTDGVTTHYGRNPDETGTDPNGMQLYDVWEVGEWCYLPLIFKNAP